VRLLLDALAGSSAVSLTGARSWRALPSLYRSHGVFLTPPGLAGLEQRASGARVVPLGTDRDPASVAAALDAARAAGPLPMAEIRAGLREIFTEHSTPVRLTALVRAVGLPDQAAGGRRVAVLARVDSPGDTARLAAALGRQRLRPAEVIVAAGPDAAGAAVEALGALADKGTRIEVTPGSPSDRELARLASSPWVAPWPDDGASDDTYLLDLMCARECAQADVVGLGDADYEFARSLDTPALVRRDLLAPGGPPASAWGSHGLRLFTVSVRS
jgi:hypothetical protein